MTTEMPAIHRPIDRRALRKAIQLMGILKGTMGLEGEALDRRSIRIIKREMYQRLVSKTR